MCFFLTPAPQLNIPTNTKNYQMKILELGFYFQDYVIVIAFMYEAYGIQTCNNIYLCHSKYPSCPGHEVVGIVEKIGKNVKKFNIGQKVGCSP